MGAAINQALDKLEERKQIYKRAGISYFRPWVFLISGWRADGRMAFRRDPHPGRRKSAKG